MQSQLLENLFSYKKTATLLAVYKLGLFRQIKEHGGMDKDICRQLGLNERYTELLCVYLKSEGYLSLIDGVFQLSKEFEGQLDTFENICEHENSLYHKWLSPEQLASSVSALEGRLFDKEGFSPEEKIAYDNAMYGSNVNLISFHIYRKIKCDGIYPIRCLEYGRSYGCIGQALKKHISEIKVDTISLGQTIGDQISYDVILIYNTIHYKTPEEWQITFCQMKRTLQKNGIICIADVFYREDNLFQSTVLLDWITHGGVYNIYDHEVAEQLKDSGFAKVEKQPIDAISTDLLFAYK
ncbi:MAG: hypothetical protein LBI03_09830 [Clostridiales bacterium]|jgi:hypothetical protein|nr:hypothetical protein [Clostridiales bacterium]